MKNRILFCLILFYCCISINVLGQRDLSYKFKYEIIDRKECLRLDITNNNPARVVLISLTQWDPTGYTLLRRPPSYHIIRGWNSEKEHTTLPIAVTKECTELCRTRAFTEIKAGETYSITYELFASDVVCYQLFYNKNFVEYFQSKVILDYVYNDTESYKITLESNIVKRE